MVVGTNLGCKNILQLCYGNLQGEALRIVFPDIIPITAKLSAIPFFRTQHPAVHNEFGMAISFKYLKGTQGEISFILPLSFPILAKEVPVQRNKSPGNGPAVHVSLAYRRILLSNLDQTPRFHDFSCGTAFVYV